jgi:NAD(P)-dependent dehydrogenase (short-subunit alcohol dehydrogenase family)
MIEVNLTGPILLTRAALPALERSGDAVIVNISSGIDLIGVPFYTPYAAAKAGIAQFGEALRREVAEEGIRMLTICPTATEIPMMATSGMNPVGGRDTPEAVARDSIEAIIDGRLEVIRGGADRKEMVKLNRNDPIAIDDVLRPMRASMGEASRNPSAL